VVRWLSNGRRTWRLIILVAGPRGDLGLLSNGAVKHQRAKPARHRAKRPTFALDTIIKQIRVEIHQAPCCRRDGQAHPVVADTVKGRPMCRGSRLAAMALA